MKISKILELKDVERYLISRGIVKQYQKAKKLVISWDLQSVGFKKRKPKTLKVYQFRINQKYRAFWFFDVKNEWVFKIIEISDHQD